MSEQQYDRPREAMRSDSLQEAFRPITETYQQLQDSVGNDEARAAWKYSDALSQDLTRRYHDLKVDPRFTNDYKAEEAWKAYERALPKIKQKKEQARDLLQKEAAFYAEGSIPRPKGETLKVGSAERLLGCQNEASRVVRQVERLEKQQQKNSSPIGRQSIPQLLSKEYARGIQVGGVEGATICKGTLMAAEELGLDADSFLNDLREPQHLESLDKARRYETMAQSISKRVPKPPFPRPGSSAGRGSATSGARGNVFLRPGAGSAGQRISGPAGGAAKRRRPWK